MKSQKYLLFLIVLFLVYYSYALQIVTNDDLYSGSNCIGTSFDCGSINDFIIHKTGTLSTNITQDDGLTTYVCLTYEISPGNVRTLSCVRRNGFNDSICDTLINATAPYYNKTYFYTCPVGSLTGCGWNNLNGIPYFGYNGATGFSLNTAVENVSYWYFISYVCNSTPGIITQSSRNTVVSTDNKGLICSGNNYRSVVYALNNIISLSDVTTCERGLFCDSRSVSNYTISSSINQNVCIPGCSDNAQDGDEIEKDYGGSICGNCSTEGKQKDTSYSMAKSLFQSENGILSPENPFDPQYCTLGKNTIGGVTSIITIIVLISAVVLLLLLLIIIFLYSSFALIIVRYISRKKKKVR